MNDEEGDRYHAASRLAQHDVGGFILRRASEDDLVGS
jgi:hypothetical protein